MKAQSIDRPPTRTHRLLTVEEAAHELRMNPGTVYRLAKEGTLPSVKISGKRLVPADALDKLIAAASAT